MNLSSLKPAKGAVSGKKRKGRGPGSGLGTTAGRGYNGAGSRSGHKKRAWFEGGQMPLQRRLPKRGFTPLSRKLYQVINISDVQKNAGDQKVLDPAVFKELGLIKNELLPVKILGNGELKSPLTIKAHAFSKSALKKIQDVKGNVEVL